MGYQSRVKTWIAGEVLYAVHLNAEFDAILATLIPEPDSTAQGDILYRGSSAWSRLAAGTSGYFLKTQGASANPTWASLGITYTVSDAKKLMRVNDDGDELVVTGMTEETNYYLMDKPSWYDVTSSSDTDFYWSYFKGTSTGGTAASKAFGGSNSYFHNVLSYFIKEGDGSGHCFVAWAQLGDAGDTGYNEFGGYQGCIIVDGTDYEETSASPTGKHYAVFIEGQIYAYEPDAGESNKHILCHLSGQRVSSTDTLTDMYIGILLDELSIGLTGKSTDHNQWDKAIKIVGDWKYGFVFDEFGATTNIVFQCRTTGESYPRFKMQGDGKILYGDSTGDPAKAFYWSDSGYFVMGDDLVVSPGYINATSYIYAGSSLIAAGDLGAGIASTLALTNVATAYVDGSGSQAPKGVTGAGNPTFGGWLKLYTGTTTGYIPYYTAIQ